MKTFSTVIQLLFTCFCALGLLLALGTISPVQAQPDLVALRGKALGKPTWTSPYPPISGQPTVLAIQVKNVGGGFKGTFLTTLFVDNKPVQNWSFPSEASIKDMGSKVFFLPPGGSRTFEYQITMRNPGKHTIRVVVDPKNQVKEANKQNNVLVFSETWISPQAMADLVVADISHEGVLALGQPQVWKVTIKNRGKVEAVGPFFVNLKNTEGKQIGFTEVKSLAPGKSLELTFKTAGVEKKLREPEKVTATVDMSNLVAEVDENNNFKTKHFQYAIIVKPTTIAQTTSSAVKAIMSVKTKIVAGVCWEAQGAGMAITNLDGNARPEMILMAIDNPPKMNSFRYKIGWNLDTSGFATSWSKYIDVAGVGWEAQGAGMAITNLDGNARPEMILMAVDNPPKMNSFRYKIGWNLDTSGVATSWSKYIDVAGVGWEAQGAGMAITNLDGNARPEMILMAVDNPPKMNSFRYKIGWNLNTSGVATSWSKYIDVAGVGWEAQGAGMAITNLDGNARPEMILMAVDNPPKMNSFRYKIGWNLDTSGVATSWSKYKNVAGVGSEAQGADIAIFNLDTNPASELVFMAYDNPPEANTFRYTIVNNEVPAKRIRLEMDRLTTVNWPPASVVRSGVTNTLQSIYAVAGIDLNPVQNEGNIADLHTPTNPPTNPCFTDAELDAFRQAHMNSPGPAGTWHTYGAFLTCHTGGILGIMFDTNQRRAFAVFANGIAGNAEYLRTTAHELGHALNVEHSDGDAWIPPNYPTAGTGRTIMNQTGQLAAGWDYGWSASSLHHFYDHPEDRWRPRSGITWANCH